MECGGKINAQIELCQIELVAALLGKKDPQEGGLLKEIKINK
jgi:hypothetical protein